jgi:hypothetical protein
MILFTRSALLTLLYIQTLYLSAHSIALPDSGTGSPPNGIFDCKPQIQLNHKHPNIQRKLTGGSEQVCTG